MENNFDSKYIENRYDESINYYWKASKKNKFSYKLYRSLTIILGALLTLIASLSSAEFIESNESLSLIFKITTPLIAAILAIIGGFAQSFHWGATWRDMVINAMQLQNDKEQFLSSNSEDRNIKEELEKLNNRVINESKSFFQRVLDSESSIKNETEKK